MSKTLDTYLDEVDYSYLASNQYRPTDFALNFVNFIKAVNHGNPEANKTPPVHYAMLDSLSDPNPFLVNLLFRGAAKTTLFGEYLILYLAIFRELPVLGEVPFMMYVGDSIENGVKSLRKNVEHRYNNSDFLQHWIPEAKFTETVFEFKNKSGQPFAARLFGAATGIRGVKMFNARPKLAVLDDLIGDSDANSKTLMKTIEDTVYNGVFGALDPRKRKIVMNGTPFNKNDIIVKAVESGAWKVNVFPVCEKFPCTKEEFKGAWEDRFTYESVKQSYETLTKAGKEASFNQELMLRLSSLDDRIIKDSDIKWYKRSALMDNAGYFNFYITTDFAFSSKQTADYSVIAVWAYNANGDWFWVDGFLDRCTADVSVDALFRLAARYRIQSAGIETTGQQAAMLQLIKDRMMQRNIWFTLAGSKPGSEGIKPTIDKFSRLNLVVPLFKQGKIYFPEELKKSSIIKEYMNQLSLVTVDGIKGKDDALDTISMLAYMNAWRPSQDSLVTEADAEGVWGDDYVSSQTVTRLDSYLA